MPALFVAAMLGGVYQWVTTPQTEASTAGLIQAGGLVAAPEQDREASTGLVGGEPEDKEAGAGESAG